MSNHSHHFNSFYRVFTCSSFSWQHNSISTVQDSVSNVRSFCPCRNRVFNHRLEHLCCYDTSFSLCKRFVYNHFLNHRHFFRSKLDTKVTTSNHYSVNNIQNRFDVFNSFRFFDFCNDRYISTKVTQIFFSEQDIVFVSDKRQSKVICIVVYSKFNKVNVTFCNSRKALCTAGDVDTFSGFEQFAVNNFNTYFWTFFCNNLNFNFTVIEKDIFAFVNIVSNAFVVYRYDVRVCLFKSVFEHKLFAGFDCNRFDKITYSDFWTLKVNQNWNKCF